EQECPAKKEDNSSRCEQRIKRSPDSRVKPMHLPRHVAKQNAKDKDRIQECTESGGHTYPNSRPHRQLYTPRNTGLRFSILPFTPSCASVLLRARFTISSRSL